MKPNYIYAAIGFVLLTALAILISRPDADALPERIVMESKHAAQQAGAQYSSLHFRESASRGKNDVHPQFERHD